mmetsp:Transcript_35098/g.108730  ORF Transcript_35098/g.108730 Transcript_35098/m.108730 type:complete len:95 (-) Transcript_35098:5814-6098(-)
MKEAPPASWVFLERLLTGVVSPKLGDGGCRDWFFYASRKAGGNSNLVDSASSHTLVSKIKPCMSKYKRSCTVKLRMAHYISYSLFDSPLLHGYP